MIRQFVLASLALGAGLSAASAEWPERTIEIIVPFAAGGGTDATARLLQENLASVLGQSVVVNNLPGAAGEMGLAALARAEPDGYTLGILNLPPLFSIPISKDAAFSPSDIMPVANLVSDPSALSVAANGRFATMEELIEHARANPGDVTIGTTGVGTDDHLALSLLAQVAGVEFTHVPYPGAGPVRTALLGGHVDAAALNLGEAMPDMQGGDVVILAHFGANASSLAPDVPTARSLGYDVEMGSERGIGVPAGTDPAIVEALAAAIETATRMDTFVTRNEAMFTEVNYMPTAVFAEHLDRLQAHYQQIWDAGPWEQN